jgi:hypothetical protein
LGPLAVRKQRKRIFFLFQNVLFWPVFRLILWTNALLSNFLAHVSSIGPQMH